MSIKFGLVDGDGKIVARSRVKTASSAGQGVIDMVEHINKILAEQNLTVNDIGQCMVVMSSVANANYVPYVEPDTSFSYTEAQQLKEWDYLLPQEGKKGEQTKVIYFDGTEDWFMENTDVALGGTGYRIGIHLSDFKVTASDGVEDEDIIVNMYDIVTTGNTWFGERIGASSGGKDIMYVYDPKYCATNDRSLWKAHLAELSAAGNPLTVAYKTATATETDLKPEKASYFANTKGQEIVEEGETKNSEYGATVTIEQDYYVWIGGEE
jgi:hypothetical protein